MKKKPESKPREHKGWPKGKPRKLPGAVVRRLTVGLTEEDSKNLDKVMQMFELGTDADAIRIALQLVAVEAPTATGGG